MRTLYIIGAGGLGRETAVLVERINASASPEQKWDLTGFVDDDPGLQNTKILGYPVLGGIDWLGQRRGAACALAIGDPAARRRIIQRLPDDTPFPPLVDPTLFLHPSVSIGTGSLLYRGAVVMVAARVGRFVVVDANATVGHDASLGNYATVHPGVNASGNTTIGAGVRLGAGSVVLPGVSIGGDAQVGAGAVVDRDLPAGCTAVGVPARPIGSQ